MLNQWGNIANYSVKMLLTILFAVRLDCAQQPPEVEPEIDEILHRFKSSEWETRTKAFYRLVALGWGDPSFVGLPLSHLVRKYPSHQDRIKVALIGLLEKENLRVRDYTAKRQRFDEDYSNYYGDVIAAVVTFKDPRSMEALLGAISTGGMATRTLAAFAPASLDPVLAKLQDKDPMVRSSAIFVLQKMLEPPINKRMADTGSRSKIKTALLRATGDANPVVRESAVEGLAALGDTDVLPLLQKLAQYDPAYLPGQAKDGKDLYYVRNAAKQALAKLRQKKPKP